MTQTVADPGRHRPALLKAQELLPDEKTVNGSAVRSLTASTYVVPTEQPEADGTLSWDSTTLILAEVTGAGRSGLGWTYSSRACQAVIEDTLAPVVVGRDVEDAQGIWAAMVAAIRNLGRPGIASAAIAAVDTALWD